MNRLTTIGHVLATLTIIIGIVHEAMTFHPMIPEGFARLDAAWRNAITYFSLGSGGLVFCAGFCS